MKIPLLLLSILIISTSKPLMLLGGQSNMVGVGCDFSKIPKEYNKKFENI